MGVSVTASCVVSISVRPPDKRVAIMERMPKSKELESRLQRTEQQLSVFQKVSRFMVRDLSLQDVLQGIVSLVVEFTQCDSCLVYLLDGEDLVLCASNTPHPSTIGKLRMRSNEGLTGWVARERRLLAISREAYKDARFKTFGELPEDTYRSVPFGAGDCAQPRGGRDQRAAPPAASAHRQRNGSADHGRRAGRLRAGAGAHVARGAGIRQSCGTGAFLGPGADETIELTVTIPFYLARVRAESAGGVRCTLRQAPRWRMQYFYDEEKSELVVQDLQFPVGARGWRSAAIQESKGGRSRWRW